MEYIIRIILTSKSEKANAVAQSVSAKSKELDAKYNISSTFTGVWNRFSSTVSGVADTTAKKVCKIYRIYFLIF